MNESLLHLATVWYVEHHDDWFMKFLLSIGVNIIDEDSAGDIPPFAIALCDTD